MPLFKVTYKSTIQLSRNFHALFTKTLENPDSPAEQLRTSQLRLRRDPRVAAPIDKCGAEEDTARRQSREAADSATSGAQVEGITGERPMDNRQQTDR